MTEIVDELTVAEGQLHKLIQEQADLPEKLRRTTAKADAAELLNIRERSKELPALIAASRLTVARLSLNRDRTKLAETQSDIEKARVPVEETLENYKRARETYQNATARLNHLISRANSLEARVERARHQVGDLERRFLAKGVAA